MTLIALCRSTACRERNQTGGRTDTLTDTTKCIISLASQSIMNPITTHPLHSMHEGWFECCVHPGRALKICPTSELEWYVLCPPPLGLYSFLNSALKFCPPSISLGRNYEGNSSYHHHICFQWNLCRRTQTDKRTDATKCIISWATQLIMTVPY